MDGLEMDVGEKQRRPLPVHRRLVADQGSQRVVTDDDRDDDDERRRRNDAPGAPSVETAQGSAPCPIALTQQQPGDDKPRDDEEDVDADVARVNRQASVICDDGKYRDRPQPLYVGPELSVTWGRSRLVASDREAVNGDRHDVRCPAPEESKVSGCASGPPTT